MKLKAKHIGGLPFEAINIVLSLTLKHNVAYLSDSTIAHMRERHPTDFDLCAASLEITILQPDYVGQSPLHPTNFVLIKEIAGKFILVAMSAVQDDLGDYPVQSSYLIDRATTQRRLRKGYFKPL